MENTGYIWLLVYVIGLVLTARFIMKHFIKDDYDGLAFGPMILLWPYWWIIYFYKRRQYRKGKLRS